MTKETCIYEKRDLHITHTDLRGRKGARIPNLAFLGDTQDKRDLYQWEKRPTHHTHIPGRRKRREDSRSCISFKHRATSYRRSCSSSAVTCIVHVCVCGCVRERERERERERVRATSYRRSCSSSAVTCIVHECVCVCACACVCGCVCLCMCMCVCV